MTLLYAKSRHLLRAAVWLVVLGAATLAWGSYQLRVPHVSSGEGLPIPVLLVVPLGSALVIGASAGSAMQDLEGSAALDLRVWRLGHAIGLSVLGAALLVPGTVRGTGGYGVAAAIRNLTGYAGLALVGVCLLGAGLSWVLPVAYALTAMVLAVNSPSVAASWAWPVRPATEALSWGWAVVLAVAGAVAYARFGARQPAAEDPLDAG